MGHTILVQTLLKKKADPNIVDNSGNNTLHYAAGWGSKAMVGLLLSEGTNPDLQNAKEQTPLQVAKKMGRTEIAGILERFDAPGTPREERELMQEVVSTPNREQNVTDAVVAELCARLGNLELTDPIVGQFRLLQIKEKALGTTDLGLASTLLKIATLCRARSTNPCNLEAVAILRRCLHIIETAKGLNHVDTAVAANNLGEALCSVNAFEEASQIFSRSASMLAMKDKEGDLATRHEQNYLNVLRNLAVCRIEV